MRRAMATASPQTAATGTRRLVRPRENRMVAGVAAGVARYFDVDPTVVRIVFAILLVITWFTAGLAYAAAWLLMPEEEWPHQAGGTAPPRLR